VANRPTDLPPEDLDRVQRLEERLGVPIADRARALGALTHKSFVNEHRDLAGEDNERLEFLGDAVIDLLASEYLVERFPAAREGELSKLRAAVVDEAGLAAIGRSLGLGELLRLGRGEELTGGREKASLLADATEAVVAAVFLDGGLPAARAMAGRFLDEAYARASDGSLDRDYKTQLQEIGQARHRSSPRYRVVAESGPDHAKTFEIEVDIRGAALGRGSGKSKKDAEQRAAQAALGALAAGASVPAPPSAEARPPPPTTEKAATAPPAGPSEGVTLLEAPVPPLAPPRAAGRSRTEPPRRPSPRKQAKPRAGVRASRKGPAQAPAKKGTPRKKSSARARKIAEPRTRR
jgi:ribonuclease III